MFDNGLLKFYGLLPSYQGFLDISPIMRKRNIPIRRGAVLKKIDGEKYYLKSAAYKDCRFFTKKSAYDAEILLSQLYAKLGVETAIYLPAVNGEKRFLLSNNIASHNVISATDHLYPYFGFREWGEVFIKDLPFLSKNKIGLEPSPEMFVSREAMRQQTIMRILDVASYNTDRHQSNYYYNVDAPENVQQEDVQGAQTLSGLLDILTSLMDRKEQEVLSPYEMSLRLTPDSSRKDIMDYYRDYLTKGVVSIDYGASGDLIRRLKYDPELEESVYYRNDFGIGYLTASGFKQEIIDNEKLAELVDKQELAEQIGSVDPIQTAHEVTQITGYEFNREVVDSFASSYDEMAEILTH